ncbi:MAG: hypothetical protein Q7S40_01655 [Opitutaceae bacterium]|nr:hypothetical protein [Opitutaceae bacterium]
MTTLPRAVLLFVALLVAGAVRATTVAPPTFPQLVQRAEIIVRGIVTDVRCEEFDSPQGRGIQTFVTLRVERALKGSPGATVTLNLLGGKVGQRHLNILGVPEFKVGDRQIVFVSNNGRVVCPLVGLGHGRFHVRRAATGREFIARDNGVPLASEDEVSVPLGAGAVLAAMKNPERALTPSDFESRIAALAVLP